MSVNLLPSKWETGRLNIIDSTLDQVLELQQVYDACAYIGEWAGAKAEDEPERPMLAALTEGALPPNGSKEFFKLQSIQLSDTGQLIGYLQVYHGYPGADVLWLAVLAIHPELQRKGYGQELTRGLVETASKLNSFSRTRLGVALKNWPALRFWVQAGFDKIVQMRGDPVYSDKTFAFLILEKILPSRAPLGEK